MSVYDRSEWQKCEREQAQRDENARAEFRAGEARIAAAHRTPAPSRAGRMPAAQPGDPAWRPDTGAWSDGYARRAAQDGYVNYADAVFGPPYSVMEDPQRYRAQE